MDTNEVKTNVSGGVSDLTNKVKAKKTNCSRFFITINLNKGYPPGKREHLQSDAAIIDDLMKEMLDGQNLGNFMKFRDPSHSLSPQYIHGDIECPYSIELGKKYHKLHIHMMIDIKKHSTNLQVDRAKIEKFFQERLGINEKVHIDIKLIPKDNHMSILDYINKGIAEPEFEEVETV